jgi:GT2 family glycosyltransferase
VHADAIVVNHFGADDVAGCLDALGGWPWGRLWLVDNSDDAGQARALAALAADRPWVTLRVNAANLGFGAACNRAFAESDAPRVLLLNPDARIAQADVLRLAGAMDADRTLAAVSPRTFWDAEQGFVLTPPGPQGPDAALAPWALALRPGGAAAKATRAVLAERAAAAQEAVRPVDWLAGAVLLLDRAAVQRAGGLFDPRFFMFFEDADLSLRLRRQGARLALVQTAQAVHATCHTPAKAALMARAALAYFDKHHRAFLRASDGLRRTALPAALAARADVAGANVRDRERWPHDAQALGPVLAFSPSPQGWPAPLRPAGQAAQPFSAAQWALLAPGEYRALVPVQGTVQGPGPGPAPGGGWRWTGFVRPSASAPMPASGG